MSDKNKAILEAANAAIAQGNYEEFLSFCTDDTQWTLVGDKTLQGKEAVRQWMATEYVEPPLNISLLLSLADSNNIFFKCTVLDSLFCT